MVQEPSPRPRGSRTMMETDQGAAGVQHHTESKGKDSGCRDSRERRQGNRVNWGGRRGFKREERGSHEL